MSGRLLAVVAHPDDDTFGCAGSVALHAEDPAFRFALVHVTSGEAGEISDPALATRETLGEVREEEDRRSWRTLGREPDRHEFFRLPDGGVAGRDRESLIERIAAVMRDERPDVVSTFGPDGVTAHPDHIAVGEAATEAFHRVRAEGLDVRRLLHVGVPAWGIRRMNEILVTMGEQPFPTEDVPLYQPRGVADETIGVTVDCGPVADRKLAAIREHRTQANEMRRIPEELRREMRATESHVIAWPERPRGAPVLPDIFANLA